MTSKNLRDEIYVQKEEENENGIGLMEIFNRALRNIIYKRKRSVVSTAERQKKKKLRPAFIWLSENVVDSSSQSEIVYSGENVQEIIDDVSQKGFDEYLEWIDGSTKLRYSLTSREAQSHSSGWAMKYTNNHNKYVLKKTCVGVLVCSHGCRTNDGGMVRIRPAISDKVRERQLRERCPKCQNGRIVHRKCSGNNGYPVTHFWIHHVDCIQFECKGQHNHPRPQAKRSAVRKRDQQQNLKYITTENTEMYPRPRENIKMISSFHYGDYVRGCDVTEGNEHVTVATVAMRELAHEMFSRESISNIRTASVLCRTFPNFAPGFDLLESRILSPSTPEVPLVLVTLYRCSGVDGILAHIKHLTSMCSSSLQKIRVPQWNYLIHDFSHDLTRLTVETIVNLMVDTQMQTLLNEFQYKSVSSLYKMLRQKMMGTLRSFEEHYRICRYDLMLRIQDPFIVATVEKILTRLHDQCCTTKEYYDIDVAIKEGVLGTHVRDFWLFWSNEIISSTIFPVVKTIHDLSSNVVQHQSEMFNRDEASLRIRDVFFSLVEWIKRRNTIYLSCKGDDNSRHVTTSCIISEWMQTCREGRKTNNHVMPAYSQSQMMLPLRH